MIRYIQHDNEKPIKIPVREPEKLPKNNLVVIKGKQYRILTPEIEPIIDLFWGSDTIQEMTEQMGEQETSNYEKWRENMKILKLTKKYPKD